MKDCDTCGKRIVNGERDCFQLRKELDWMGGGLNCWRPEGTILIWDEVSCDDDDLNRAAREYIKRIEGRR